MVKKDWFGSHSTRVNQITCLRDLAFHTRTDFTWKYNMQNSYLSTVRRGGMCSSGWLLALALAWTALFGTGGRVVPVTGGYTLSFDSDDQAVVPPAPDLRFGGAR